MILEGGGERLQPPKNRGWSKETEGQTALKTGERGSWQWVATFKD